MDIQEKYSPDQISGFFFSANKSTFEKLLELRTKKPQDAVLIEATFKLLGQRAFTHWLLSEGR